MCEYNGDDDDDDGEDDDDNGDGDDDEGDDDDLQVPRALPQDGDKYREQLGLITRMIRMTC